MIGVAYWLSFAASKLLSALEPMNEEQKQLPATKGDLEQAIIELRNFVLDREASLIWKVIALQVTLIAAIAGAQWAAITFTLTHWKP